MAKLILTENHTKLGAIEPQQGSVVIQRRDPELGEVMAIIDSNNFNVVVFPVVEINSHDINLIDANNEILALITSEVVGT